MMRTAKFAVIVGVALLPGCGFRDREGLFARFRARLNGPDYVYSAPLAGLPSGYDMGPTLTGVPFAGVPVSINGNMPCPCSTLPGLPVYPPPEILPPGATPGLQPSQPPASPMPTQPGQTPGTAPTKPAEPSDPNGSPRNTPLATSKPSGL